MDNNRPTWAEINLSAIRNNICAIREKTSTNIMAIVKANAYGHGVGEICKVCVEEGIPYLGVSSLDEALEIRAAGITIPILILGYMPEDHAELAIEHDISVTVFNLALPEALSKAALKMGKKAKLHIKIDTGMGRLGFAPDLDTVDKIVRIAKLPGIESEGIFTHFAVADAKDKDFSLQQLNHFNYVVDALEKRGIRFKIKHTANSAAALDIPTTYLDMVRVGIILYGLYPSPEVSKLNLIPALRLKSKVSLVKTLPAGSTVGYGRNYRCENPVKIATVPIGYADGYSRLLSNRAWAVIKGYKVPLVGNVCMDQCMFDVSEVEGTREGDEVILLGREEDGITADDLADIMGTINYEVICSISARVPRIYI